MAEEDSKEALKERFKGLLEPSNLLKFWDNASDELKSELKDFAQFLVFSQTEEYQASEKIAFLKYFYIHDKPLTLFAWKAIAIAEKYSFNPPLWAVSIVTSTANDLLLVKTAKNEFHRSLCDALGFDGQDLKYIQKIEDMLDIYFKMIELVEIDKRSMTASATELCDKYGYSKTSIIDCYHAYNAILDKGELPNAFEDFEQKV